MYEKSLKIIPGRPFQILKEDTKTISTDAVSVSLLLYFEQVSTHKFINCLKYQSF